ncbi:response regulator transcription factor [Paenibacillus puerhi]|uniref:response regulator transcription factor n=1 Tax=Paenibacillus puerhi TaxID=2692622 RepID=UPI00135914EF|nr:response regulator [Paenibacillus puerhi]
MRLLIVDDEPVIRLGLAKMAEAYEPRFTQIQTAENGKQALELIAESEPDLVLTDIRMPKMDGLALCRTLYEEHPVIRVAIISGYNDFEYAQQCMEYGVKHYVLKPIARPDLHELLNKILKASVRGYVPVSHHLEWIDRLEQCIWSIQLDELHQAVRQWSEQAFSVDTTTSQAKSLLEDCSGLLLKRLQSRKYVPADAKSSFSAISSVKEAIDEFERRLFVWTEGLLTIRNGNFKDPMEEARAYIDSHLSQDISLDQVAQMVGLTPNYFSAVFKKMTNETFVQYRIHKRMERAKELLSTPHIRIVDVASEVGYEDYPHFTKTFKKIVGSSPSEYRTGLGIR